jgi:hypothetical protein
MELPELVPTEESLADVSICIAPIPVPDGELGKAEGDFHISENQVYFHWDEVGSFLACDGSEIVIDPNPLAEPRLVRSPLLGMVFAVLMHQRGFLVLHGSAIDIGGCTAVFLGDKGMGKSTMAATLHSRGHRLVSDDVVVVDMSVPGRPRVYAAFPQFKLWPDAITALGRDPEASPRIAEQYEKRVSKVSEGFSFESVPLKNLYVLGRGEGIEIEPLGSQVSIIELIRNSHATRLGRFLPRSDQQRNFLQCSQLLGDITVYSLRRPYTLSLLPDVSEALERHMGFVSVAV